MIILSIIINIIFEIIIIIREVICSIILFNNKIYMLVHSIIKRFY